MRNAMPSNEHPGHPKQNAHTETSLSRRHMSVHFTLLGETFPRQVTYIYVPEQRVHRQQLNITLFKRCFSSSSTT